MNNKIFYGAVGLVAILVLAFLGFRLYYVPDQKSGASVESLRQTGVTAYEDVAAGDASRRAVLITLGSGTSTAIMVNRAPFTRWITDNSLLTLTGPATDTPFRIYVGTTTSIKTSFATSSTDLADLGDGQVVPAYLFPAYASLVNGYFLATSTAASSTPLSALPKAGYGPTRVFPWLSGQGIFITLLTDTGNGNRNVLCTSQTGISMCSSATATDRGFNIELLLDTYSTSTVR